MNEDKISVLVSVYNEGQYLNQCIDSVVKQDYQNWELILVDDGSTDNSLAIAQKWVEKDSRIRLVQQEHKGLCAARNRGIELAQGDYYFFLDADDFLTKDCLARLLQAVSDNQAEVAATNYYTLQDGWFYFHLNPKNYFTKTYTVKNWFKDMPNHGENRYDLVFVCLWGKLFKQDLFNNLVVPEDKKIDDAYTTWKLYLQANKIVYCNFAGYCYRTSNNSMNKTVKQFAVDDVEEQFAMLAMLDFPLTEIKNSYLYQLNRAQNEALKNGQYDIYKDLTLKLNIINKYRK